MRNIAYSFFLFLTILNLNGQSTIGISLLKDTLNIGEWVDAEINIRTRGPRGIIGLDLGALDTLRPSVHFTEGSDTLDWYAEVELANIDKDQTISPADFIKGGGFFNYKKKFKFKIWDIGAYALPAPEIIMDTSITKQRVVPLQSKMTLVIPPEGVAPPDSTQMIIPITDIIREDKTWKDYYMILYFILPLLLIGVLYILYRVFYKKKSEEVEEEKIILPAHIIAENKLSSLKDEELWQQGLVKEYQSKLTYIIREYLENRYDVNALEQTTGEILTSLLKKDFQTDHQDTLQRILQMADLVKFAKAKPEMSIHEEFMADAENFITATKQTIVELNDADELV